MVAVKKIIVLFLFFGAVCAIMPVSILSASAEGLFSDQPFRLNDPAMSEVQEIAPLEPLNGSYNYLRSAGLSIVSDLPATVALGQTVSLKIMVKPGEGAINAVKASLAYSIDTLKLVAVDGEGTPFSIIFDEQAGEGKLAVTAMQPAPGVNSESRVAELYFIAVAPGEARIDFQPDSVVLANDGYGSDVLAFAQGTSFAVSGY